MISLLGPVAGGDVLPQRPVKSLPYVRIAVSDFVFALGREHCTATAILSNSAVP